MDELRDIGDLRPAPRPTPPRVLWVMGVVAVGGIWFLATSLPETTGSLTAVNLPANGAASSPRVAAHKLKLLSTSVP